MKPADSYQAVDHTDVLAVNPRHARPASDDVVLSLTQRTAGGGRPVLLTRQHAAELRDWLDKWIAEGWDGVPHRPDQAPGLARLCPDCALTLPAGALAHDCAAARAGCGACGVTAAARCTGCGGCECDCTCSDEATWAACAQAVTASLPLEGDQP